MCRLWLVGSENPTHDYRLCTEHMTKLKHNRANQGHDLQKNLRKNLKFSISFF